MAVAPETREIVLRERVRDVYTAFRGYRLAPHIEPDACFPGVCDDRPLRADSLHRLPPSAFENYQWKAITTWGSVDDFKHFLPRLLEIAATTQAEDTSTQVEAWRVFGKLRYGKWRRWKSKEQQVLDAFFDALWSALLARPVDASGTEWQAQTLGDWLSSFAHAHEDLSRFLSQWEAEAGDSAQGLMAAAHLAQTVVRSRDGLLKKGSLDWDMYNELDGQEAQMMAWLASDAVRRSLEAAFFHWSASPYAALLSDAHEWLGWWRQRLLGGA